MDTTERKVVLIGGHGGMTAQYRTVAEELGLELQHFERNFPAGKRHDGLVIVMTSAMSHKQLDQVRKYIEPTSIVYLSSDSISALREALRQQTGRRAPKPDSWCKVRLLRQAAEQRRGSGDAAGATALQEQADQMRGRLLEVDAQSSLEE